MIFENALVLGPEGLSAQSLAVLDGVICDETDARSFDLSGYWIMPGLIDVHGDGFERHLAPRRGALRDLGQGLMSADAELAANGITTATLAQFYSWEGGMRGPEFARRFLEALKTADLLTDTRVQLRFETHLLADYSAFEELVAEFDVPYVVFNDHIPHDALAKGKRPPRHTGQALKSGRSPEAHLTLLQELHGRSEQVPEALKALAARLTARGVRLGSHDDDTPDVRAGFQAMGIAISEFPESLETAEAANANGAEVILGAPNVVRGGSHSGKVSAAEVIAAGHCHALASDYHYPALKQAVFRLVDDGVLTLEKAWSLVSSGPAKLLGLTDRGTLEEGQRADLVILNPETRRIEATLVNGQFSHLTGGVAARFLG
ncbi:alpha-D-ribose 1-methylphosphonate 5-triphosphate diphosphatase [Cognatishimia activa]|uniref:Alpha-D-ribose 1-methylphosphonate 5-triphosphate diphosphatase n=1 Tax=Cognatishimia activa TaxID=1715691 RepID=A0A0P1IS37_9RHOB|nr:alpha-D-ribose 1-methylphosphonate 5-triphosphate diphosphatase [Cognatishimia activa]CUI63553.1 Alpha-D-ribose 1-methylphosphonate 5-triphosphate diphosphatase [Cognatishimia activa]CUK26361.1 Alpha-D-ribose 1-methylphosphonate 5-triphosphate diphosphatase [Cognatishimia activa]